ncbi:hypothetical protein [Cryobacterium mannosilyticum]|uniref:Lipoprotein n=1 Tax=Cryobacterium mannosilyticum TaxID=1259190 RepID=A0A4R8WDE7_9MICO|nr:hypothetical protein [Cryobacterium mannosilyticum]TFC07397.1 hypothetical protein E3O32_02475 [Cryobacterium mannosilyticum]
MKDKSNRARRILAVLAVLSGTAVLLSACTTTVATTEPTATGGDRALPLGSEKVTLDPKEFSAEITNRYWPMKPGTQWTYRETDGTGAVMDVEVTATGATRKIANGITARVVRDTVSQDGAVVEDTFDWYAQDSKGAIWYLGEETAEFENGLVTSTAGSFEAGVDGAQPGILLPAEPRPGQKYRQEYYRGQAEDNGEVVSFTEMATVPLGHFTEVLLTRDTITIEPDVLQYKLYAPGVGPVQILDVAGPSAGREELVSVTAVPPDTGTGPLGEPR